MEVKKVILEAEVMGTGFSQLVNGLKSAADNAGLAESRIKRLNDELVSSALKASTLQQQYNKVEKEIEELSRASQKLARLEKEATDSSDVHKYNIAWSRVNIELDKARKELAGIEKQAGKAGTKLKSIRPPKISGKFDPLSAFGNLAPIQRAQGQITSLLGVLGPGAGGLVGTLGAATAAAGPVGIALGAAAAIGSAAFSLATNEGKEFENRLLSLQAILGVTDEELEQLRQTALNTGVTFDTEFGTVEITKNAIEAAGAFEVIGSKVPILLQSQEALSEFTKRVLVLDQASQTLTFDQGVDALTTSVNQFLSDGATYNDAVALATVLTNQLAEASKIGAIPIDGAADSLRRFGAVANANSVSTASSIALVEVLGQKFNDPAVTGTALRNIIQKLSVQQGDFALKNGDVVGSLEAVGAANLSSTEFIKLFSAENEAAARILISNIGQVKEFTGALEEQGKATLTTGTAAKQAAVNSRGLENAQKNLSNEITNIKASLGSGLTPALTVLVNLLTGAIQTGRELYPVFEEIGEGFRVILSPIGALIEAFTETGDSAEEASDSGEGIISFVGILRGLLRLLLAPLSFTVGTIGRLSKAFDIAKEAGGGFFNIVKSLVNAFTFLDIFELPPVETEEARSEVDKLKKDLEDDPIEPEITIVSNTESLEALKKQLQGLQAEFNKSTNTAERAELASEIIKVQTRITEIKSVFKSDKTAEKAAKEAEREQKEIERKALAEERELETITKLKARIEVESLKSGGEDTIASLDRQLQEQLRVLRNDASFQALTTELQAQAVLNIEDDFDRKTKDVRDKLAAKIVETEEEKLALEFENIAVNFAIESLNLDSEFAARLNKEKLTSDEIAKIEEGLAITKKEKAKEALTAQLDALNKLSNANEDRIKDLSLQLTTANEEDGKKIRSELEGREQFQKTIEERIVGTQQESADAQIEITKAKIEEEEEEETKSAEEKLSTVETYLGFASQIQGAAADIFQAMKDKELAAAGDNKEKIAEIERKDFNRRKALTLIEIAINTAGAIVQAIRQFGPPPSPLGIAGISIASAIGLIQGGVVASQKPPAFFHGTKELQVPKSPGQMGKDSVSAIADNHYPIRVHSGERIIPASQNVENWDIYENVTNPEKLLQIVAKNQGIDPDLIASFIQTGQPPIIENIPSIINLGLPSTNLDFPELGNIEKTTNQIELERLYSELPDSTPKQLPKIIRKPTRKPQIRLQRINPLLPVNSRNYEEVVREGSYVSERDKVLSFEKSIVNSEKSFMLKNFEKVRSLVKTNESFNLSSIKTVKIISEKIENSSSDIGSKISVSEAKVLAEELSSKIMSNESNLDHVYVKLIKQNESIIKLLKANKE